MIALNPMSRITLVLLVLVPLCVFQITGARRTTLPLEEVHLCSKGTCGIMIGNPKKGKTWYRFIFCSGRIECGHGYEYRTCPRCAVYMQKDGLVFQPYTHKESNLPAIRVVRRFPQRVLTALLSTYFPRVSTARAHMVPGLSPSPGQSGPILPGN